MKAKTHDIIILGGGIAGSLMAISMLRKNPKLSLLIIERSVVFPPKVGESSAELTGLFFNRFSIDPILKKQIPKAGLRFLFNEHQSDDFNKMNEFSSPALKSVSNGYHFNRQVFDTDLLNEAVSLGAELLRPAEICDLIYTKLNTTISVKHNEELRVFVATWVVDASGPERIVNKKLNWGKKDLKFNTSASFAHFKGLRPVKEWDCTKNDFWDKNSIGPREHGTLQFMRKGCWWWHIKITDDVTSIGIVYDTHMLDGNNPDAFFDDYIRKDAQLNAIIGDATRGNIKHLPNLPFVSSKLYDEGIAVIGDAAAFIDPLFSPGIEFICQQSIHLSELILDYYETKGMNHTKWMRYDAEFLNGFSDRVLTYQDKYKVMGSYDLFANWVQLDFAAYFSFHVIPSVIRPKHIKKVPRFNVLTRSIYLFFTCRYVKIALRRERQGRTSSSLSKPLTYSKVALPVGYKLYLKPPQLIFAWLKNYIRIEWTELHYRCFKR